MSRASREPDGSVRHGSLRHERRKEFSGKGQSGAQLNDIAFQPCGHDPLQGIGVSILVHSSFPLATSDGRMIESFSSTDPGAYSPLV